MTTAKATAKTARTPANGAKTGAYPETEFGLAAYLFDSIAASETGQKDHDRSYYVQLMYECVRTVRAASESHG